MLMTIQEHQTELLWPKVNAMITSELQPSEVCRLAQILMEAVLEHLTSPCSSVSDDIMNIAKGVVVSEPLGLLLQSTNMVTVAENAIAFGRAVGSDPKTRLMGTLHALGVPARHIYEKIVAKASSLWKGKSCTVQSVKKCCGQFYGRVICPNYWHDELHQQKGPKKPETRYHLTLVHLSRLLPPNACETPCCASPSSPTVSVASTADISAPSSPVHQIESMVYPFRAPDAPTQTRASGPHAKRQREAEKPCKPVKHLAVGAVSAEHGSPQQGVQQVLSYPLLMQSDLLEVSVPADSGLHLLSMAELMRDFPG